jgi:hypothetical protein
MAQVSGIEVNITGNSSGLDRALGKAESSLSRFAKGAAAGIAGALSAGVFVAAGKAALNYADNIGKVAQKVGMTTEELSGLNYAAKLSDLSIEQLQSSLGIMARKMGDSAESFQAFGVSLRNNDGTMRGTNEVLMDVADKFAMMPDGVQKSQWALELFGRSGLDLIPLLNGGAASIAEMTNQARMFGVVVSQEAASGAEQFNDNITRLQQYVAGAVQSFTTGMTPALVGVSEALVNSAQSTDSFKSAGEAAGQILQGVARAVIVVKDNLGLLGEIIKGIGLVIFTRYLFGAASGFVAFAQAVKAATITMTAFNAAKKIGLVGFITLAAGIAIATDSVDELKKGLDFVYQTAQDMVPGMAEFGKQISDAIGIDLSGLQADLSAARALVEKSNAGAFIPAIPGKDGEVSKEGDGPVVPGVSPSQEVGTLFLDRFAAIQEGFKSERQLLEEEYSLNQMVLDNALNTEQIKKEEYRRLSEQLEKDHQNNLAAIRQQGFDVQLDAAASLFGSLAQLTDSGNKKLMKLSKAFSIAQVVINTAQGISKAFAQYGWPAGVGPAAAIAASGAVQLANIASAESGKIKGGSGGGSRGGGGGASAAPAAASPTTTFQFTMMNDPMGFGEKFARQFIDQLNSTQRNGGTIRGVIA